MPIKIPNDLPAVKTLSDENIFVMTESRAKSQDIRPLKILILNLMPTKIVTETQLLRLLSNTPLQVEITLLKTQSYTPTHTPQEHQHPHCKLPTLHSNPNRLALLFGKKQSHSLSHTKKINTKQYR